jgi:hypothetical protein
MLGTLYSDHEHEMSGLRRWPIRFGLGKVDDYWIKPEMGPTEMWGEYANC